MSTEGDTSEKNEEDSTPQGPSLAIPAPSTELIQEEASNVTEAITAPSPTPSPPTSTPKAPLALPQSALPIKVENTSTPKAPLAVPQSALPIKVENASTPKAPLAVPQSALPIKVENEPRAPIKPRTASISQAEDEAMIFDPANVRRTEKIDKAEARLLTNPYDTDAWAAILNEVQNANIDTFRCYFQKFLKLFPTAGRYWKVFIEREIKQKNYGRVEKLFKKHLMNCLSLDLWKCYLTYVKETKCDQPNYRDVMKKSYDFVLEHIGMDMHSTPIWQDYIDFIKSAPATNTYEEGQKMTALRHVYQKAVVNPMINVEQLWKDYDMYENSLNKLTAKKLLQDKSAAYMTARSVFRERKARTEGLLRNMLAVPPKGTAKEKQQLKIWRDYIDWEKTNPLRLENPLHLEKRVVFAYKQWLLCFSHYQEIWIDVCSYLDDLGRKDQAAVLYDKACTTLPNNLLIHFAYADLEEGRKNVNKATQIYERLLANKSIEDPTLIYIQYMKYKRRVAGIMGARVVFKKARGDPRSQYHIYVASALMEYYCSKDANTAVKIFDFGMRSYQSNVAYVLAYLDFLSSLTEDHNTRVLLERVLNTIKPEEAGPVWFRFLRFESNYGDLSSILKVEKRRQEAIQGRMVTHAIERYRYLDIYPCTDLELDLGGYVKPSDSTGPATTEVTGQGTSGTNQYEEQQYPMPDLGQWVAFNPEAGRPAATEPKVLRQLLQQLPPPTSFAGPFANVDMLLDMLEVINNVPALPNTAPIESSANSNGKSRRGDGKGTHHKKRRDEDSDDDTHPEMTVTNRGPAQDIFRKRQRLQLAQ